MASVRHVASPVVSDCQRLVESLTDHAIFRLDRTGHIVTWSPGAERLTGYPAGEIVGKHYATLYADEEAGSGKCDRVLEVAVSSGRYEEDGWRLRRDGGRFWANEVINPIRDEGGGVLGFAVVARERSDASKDEFLAILGHELRNPLAPIRTALQLMKLRGDQSTAREQQVIERQVSHMQRLVDDLLDVSRLARGKILLKLHRHDLRDVLAAAVEVASPMLELGGHHLRLDLPNSPIPLNGDHTRLTQVFANLLVNAARYTESGGHIRVAVSTGAGEVLVEVVDDGSGIAPDLMPQLFELFVQGRGHRHRGAGGLGIGLTLVRSLVKLHGGSVEARSDGPGKGSTFSVRLPLASEVPDATAPDASPLARPAARRARILIVDDNEDAAMLLAELLSECGHEVKTASDAPSALELIAAYTPEIAILDIGLPVIDGVELALKLREQLGPRTPKLIALTGYGQSDHQERTRQAGFAAHFVKPVEAEELLQTISAV